MAVFRKFKGPNIKYSHRDPQKALLTRNDVIWRILRKYPSRGVGCNLIEEPQKKEQKLVTPKARQNHVFGEQKPLKLIATKFCMPVAVQDVITPANFCEDRLRVLVWREVEFWPFQLTCFVAFKTLSHYRASVWCHCTRVCCEVWESSSDIWTHLNCIAFCPWAFSIPQPHIQWEWITFGNMFVCNSLL